VDTKTCPICGGNSEGAMVKDATAAECWCYTAEINDEAMQRVPEDARGKVCICARCAAADTSAS
jgi:hypothetical protein